LLRYCLWLTYTVEVYPTRSAGLKSYRALPGLLTARSARSSPSRSCHRILDISRKKNLPTKIPGSMSNFLLPTRLMCEDEKMITEEMVPDVSVPNASVLDTCV